jgi:tetratricopeptide (TPR) repeat protein/DNA-binding CsgD family transcriptional regulator
MKPHYLAILISFVFSLSSHAQNLSHDEAQRIHQYQLSQFQKLFSQPDEVKPILDSLQLVGERFWPDSLRASNHLLKGSYYSIKSELDSSIYHFKQNLVYIDSNSARYPKMLNNLAVMYNHNGQYAEALELADKATKTAKNRKDFKSVSLLKAVKSVTYARLEDYKTALNFQKKVITTIEENELNFRQVPIEYHNLANLYRRLNMQDLAIAEFKATLPRLKANELLDTYYLGSLNLSHSYLETGQLALADSLLSLSHPKIVEFGHSNILDYYQELRAKYYTYLGDSERALGIYRSIFNKEWNPINERLYHVARRYMSLLESENLKEEATEFALWILDYEKNNPQQQFGLKSRIKFYIQAKDYLRSNKETYDKLLLRTLSLQDSLNDRNEELAKQHFYESLAFQDKLQEKKILEKDLASSTYRIYLLLGLGTLLLLGSAYYFYRYKIGQKKAGAALSHAATKAKKLNKDLQAVKTEKNKAEETLAIQKSEILALTAKFNQVQQKYSKAIYRLDKETQQQLLTHLGNTDKAEDYWAIIKDKFIALNPDFIQQLKAHYPAITSSQIDFCALIRINLSNKEIAKTLSITPQSVITRKYRLKKKFNLEKDVDFTRFILDL